MPHFNIHWKGCPHRRLPRIRSASVGSRSRSLAQIAAEEVRRRPLSAELERERRKQRLANRRRQGRSSKTSSAAVQVRKRSSRPVRYSSTQSLGRSTSQIYLVRGITGERIVSRNLVERSRSVSNSPPISPHVRSKDAAVDFKPGDRVGGSTSRTPRSQQPNNIYPVTGVADTRAYWTSASPVNRKRPFDTSLSTQITPKFTGEEGLRRKPARQRNNRPLHTASWGRNYDPRIYPNHATGNVETPGLFTDVSLTKNPDIVITSPHSSFKTERKATTDDPELWGTLDSTREPAETTQSGTTSITSSSQNFESEFISRTKSRTRELNRFAKELGLHWKAVQSLPNQTLFASPSTTTISAHTIGEFLPFHAEFQAAGLAITSLEQRGVSPRKLIEKKGPFSENVSPKNMTGNSEQQATRQDMNTGKRLTRIPGNDGLNSSVGSTSIGTTIIGFTPPHEKTYGQRTEQKRAYTPSSEFTAIGFTPPHEIYLPKPKASAPAPAPAPQPQVSARASIPWLRKPSQSPKAPLSVAKISNASTYTNGKKPQPMAQVFEDEANQDPDIGWNNLKYEGDDSPHQVSLPRYKQRCDAATQTDPIYATSSLRNDIWYSDVGTQTGLDVSNSLPPEVKDVTIHRERFEMIRAPISSGRSKSFPPAMTKRSEEPDRLFGNAGLTEGENKSSPKPLQPWKGHDHQTQTIKNNYFSISTATHSTYPENRPLEGQRNGGKAHSGIPHFGSAFRAEKMAVQAPSVLTHEASVLTRCTQCHIEPNDSTQEIDGQMQSNNQRGVEEYSTIASQQCCPQRSTFDSVYSPDLQQTATNEARKDVSTGLLESPVKPLCNDRDHVNDSETRPQQRSYDENSIDEYAKLHPVKDPVKRRLHPLMKPMVSPTYPNSSNHRPSAQKHRHHHSPKAHHSTSSHPGPRHRTSSQHNPHRRHSHQKPPVHLKDRALLDSKSGSATSLETRTKDYYCACTDQQLFHGLHVAAVACCDPSIDRLIEEVTGCGVRDYLADLSKLDGLERT
ncbi:hypothetical protein G7Y89_g10487 [Cudoniella acicularis]|uniref:Uncharacterized protein n=1 Tax=Cudoniella acicularis TaxID=354080 RepID=A0A8H4RFE2_9HELO|nr:hypothetical protein G7Y89_g10487 [Cudoniella acicularis]